MDRNSRSNHKTAQLTILAEERVGAYEFRVRAQSGGKSVDNYKTPGKFTVRKKKGCPAPDTKNAPANLAELKRMVTGSSPLTGKKLQAIDTSLIINMANLFKLEMSFDGAINCWDVSRVISMVDTFFGATVFNQDISDWDVSKVTNMTGTFYYASDFNQDLRGWDVSGVQSTFTFASGTSDWTKPKPSWRP